MTSTARMHNILPILTIALLAGCTSGQAQLTLHPSEGHVAYAQNFTQAYCSKSTDGSYTCVLVSDETPSASAKSFTQSTLKPAQQTPLRQVVHINVLWRPLSGTRDSAVSNATIDWYVLSNTTTGNDDLLLYQGSGYVTLKPGDDVTKVDIHTGDLRPALVKGTLSDPIGTAMLSGKFLAINDTQKTRDLVNATRQRTATIAATTASGQ
jgi:hypothetical protein